MKCGTEPGPGFCSESISKVCKRGIILQGIGGFYTARDEDGVEYTLRAQGKLRREHMKPKVGDLVELSPGEGEEHGWMLRVLPRRNELIRPSVANIDVIVIVAAAAAPDPDLLLVDRLILNARRSGIDVQLVISKSDLDADCAKNIERQYRAAEISPVRISVRTAEGLDDLRKRLRGKVHAFAGQSGAGKSTMINALYGLELETGDLSKKIERGKNTTRYCRLIPVPEGGMVLDTPGFSLLETDVFDPIEMKDFWPEFALWEGKCYFQPCYHASEPRCAVREAVATGEIDRQRYERYNALLEEMRQRWRDRYD